MVIIEPAEAMTPAAANALLKSLEEPETSIFFLLVSHARHRLPATVVSRCQILRFNASLTESISVNDTAAQEQALFQEEWRSLIKGDISPVALSEKWHKYDILKIINCLLQWIIEQLKAQQTHETAVNISLLYDMYDNLLENKRFLAKSGSLNSQIILDGIFIKCYNTLRERERSLS